MTDGPAQLEQGPFSVRSSENTEVSKRAGLSPRDKTLPIRQNIIRVYGHTPELQLLGKAFSANDDGEMRIAFQKAIADAKMYYGLKVQVQKDEDILQLTRDSENKATLIGNTIIMAESVANDTPQAIVELAHEL